MKIEIDITNITIICVDSTEKIVFETALEQQIWPFNKNGQIFVMETAPGKAEEFVKLHFKDIEYKVIKGI